MKDKVIIFIIGFLVGSVIATGVFFIISKNSSNNGQQMNGGTPPQMPSGENGQPPEMPNGQNNDQQPPQMPNNFTEKKSKKSNGAVDQNDENSKIENKINKKEETNI